MKLHNEGEIVELLDPLQPHQQEEFSSLREALLNATRRAENSEYSIYIYWKGAGLITYVSPWTLESHFGFEPDEIFRQMSRESAIEEITDSLEEKIREEAVTNQQRPNTMNDQKPIFEILLNDVQESASKNLGRELNNTEIDEVKKRLSDAIGQKVNDTLDDVVLSLDQRS